MASKVSLHAICALSKSTRVEDRIGSVCLFVAHFLEHCSAGEESALRSLNQIYRNVGIKFVIQMVLTFENHMIHRSGVAFVGLLLQHAAMSSSDKSSVCEDLTAVLFNDAAQSAHDGIVVLLRRLAESMGNEILNSILQRVATTQLREPFALLTAVTDILSSIFDTGYSSTLWHLSSDAAAGLRALFLQCLHGAAPESIRDSTLDHLLLWLSWPGLSPSWTVSSTSEAEKREESSSFPVFLTSVLRNEVHLSSEEIAYFSNYLSGHIPTSTDAPPSSSTPKKEVDLQQESESRLPRAIRVFSLCSQCLGHSLRLLSDEESPVWATQLSSKDLLTMRSQFQNVLATVGEILPVVCDAFSSLSTDLQTEMITSLSTSLDEFIQPLILLDDEQRVHFIKHVFPVVVRLSVKEVCLSGQCRLLCTTCNTLLVLLRGLVDSTEEEETMEESGAVVLDGVGEQALDLFALVITVRSAQHSDSALSTEALCSQWVQILSILLHYHHKALCRLARSSEGDVSVAMAELWQWKSLTDTVLSSELVTETHQLWQQERQHCRQIQHWVEVLQRWEGEMPATAVDIRRCREQIQTLRERAVSTTVDTL